MKQKTVFLTRSALLAAAYMGLCHLQNLLLPGSASWAIQFRVAEAMCILAFFSPAAVAGLSVGCFLFNLSFSGALPLDPIIGTLATALSTGIMYLTRHFTLRTYPLFGMLMPAVFNALLVGWELSLYIGGGFLINASYVFIGEAAVLLCLGTPFFYAAKAHRLDKLF